MQKNGNDGRKNQNRQFFQNYHGFFKFFHKKGILYVRSCGLNIRRKGRFYEDKNIIQTAVEKGKEQSKVTAAVDAEKSPCTGE